MDNASKRIERILREFGKGCSCAQDNPSDCEECLDAAINAIIRADLHADLLRASDALADHVEAVAEWMIENGYDSAPDEDALAEYLSVRTAL